MKCEVGGCFVAMAYMCVCAGLLNLDRVAKSNLSTKEARDDSLLYSIESVAAVPC